MVVAEGMAPRVDTGITIKTEDSINSPSLTKGKNTPRSRNRKRLIVLCDGTWQDSTEASGNEYPSNVTRFARALSKYGFDEDGEELEQIVYYQKGVGTGLMDGLFGGILGLGVSANVRAGYSFLADNYDEGDSIYFFGFSRGAYTARAIASLVAETGLLTKRGMDKFPLLYNTYYAYRNAKRSESPEAKRRARELMRSLGHDQISLAAARAVRIVGVWDTVAFHKPWVARPLALFKLLGFRLHEERIEFCDTEVPRPVQHAFHALALDERRRAYEPTMWTLPKPTGEPGERMPVLKQVWFSGVHTDVGGGRTDHRLSDVPFAWMISECSKTRLLAFDQKYLLKKTLYIPYVGSENGSELAPAWETVHGATDPGSGPVKRLFKGAVEGLAGIRARRPLADKTQTNEMIHQSIGDRRFGMNGGRHGAVRYESKNLTGRIRDGGWELTKSGPGGEVLKEAEVGDVERELQGRIRSAMEGI